MITPEKMDNLGYVVALKGKDRYVINDCVRVDAVTAWGEDLAEVIIYPTIEAARDIVRHFNECKHEYSHIRDVEIEVRIMHKKQVMIARLQGSKDE
jgi:hypothetical protein